MEVKPVKLTEKPKYLLKTELNEEDLKKRMPKRWTQSPAAKVALGTLAVVSLSGCVYATGGTPSVTPPTEASVSATPMGTPATPIINVAPLFEHGKGVGSFGCMMVAPPAFLSEYEALAVINDAAKEYGLCFSAKDTPEFANVLQPITNLNSYMPKNGSAEQTASYKPETIITLKADFSDNERGIAIEYISIDDVKAWKQGEDGASVERYKTLDAAEQLSEALESAKPDDYGSYNIAVLYDPCAYIEPDENPDREERHGDRDELREMSEEQLKSQARDFFEWLKSQGVI